jgi:hypothetical protein
MSYCVANGGNLLRVIVWQVVICYELFCVARGGNLLWVIEQRVMVIYYGFLSSELW